MTTVKRIVELFNYKTIIKVSPSKYTKNDSVWFNTAENLLDNYEDILNKLEVECIEHNSSYINIYYSEF